MKVGSFHLLHATEWTSHQNRKKMCSCANGIDRFSILIIVRLFVCTFDLPHQNDRNNAERYDRANKALFSDLRRFWLDNTHIGLTQNLQLSLDALSTTAKMASYVPRLVIRRMCHNRTSYVWLTRQKNIRFSHRARFRSFLRRIHTPETESYPACVMFADVSGFTSLTEKLSEQGDIGIEKLKDVLNTYFESLIGIIYKFGGDIIKVER
jgi:hypothetical protein